MFINKLTATLTLFSIALFINLNIFAQSFQGKIICGLNLAQVDGDEVVGYRKPGFNTGVGAAFPFGKSWLVSLETIFNQKGAYKKFSPDDRFNAVLPYYNLRLNYAEIPLLIQYNDKNIVTGGIGFSYGRLVSGKEIEHGVKIDWKNNSPYSKNDFNVLVDVSFRVYQKMHFNFRYAYSMYRIRNRIFDNTVSVWERKQYNNLISFRIMYIFNDNYKPKSK
ncbi:MAG: PorT family protein [Bacteroidales bacterium]|nr:PorT family protein [Bacteroidales bacterium]